MQSFVHFSSVFSLCITLHNRRRMSLNFLVFHTFVDVRSFSAFDLLVLRQVLLS